MVGVVAICEVSRIDPYSTIYDSRMLFTLFVSVRATQCCLYDADAAMCALANALWWILCEGGGLTLSGWLKRERIRRTSPWSHVFRRTIALHALLCAVHGLCVAVPYKHIHTRKKPTIRMWFDVFVLLRYLSENVLVVCANFKGKYYKRNRIHSQPLIKYYWWVWVIHTRITAPCLEYAAIYDGICNHSILSVRANISSISAMGANETISWKPINWRRIRVTSRERKMEERPTKIKNK